MVHTLAVGSFLVGVLLWVTRLQSAPDMTPELWKALAPVALFHTLGHVTACIAFGAMAVGVGGTARDIAGLSVHWQLLQSRALAAEA